MKQKVSNIILLMYSAQFIKFKRLAISVKKKQIFTKIIHYVSLKNVKPHEGRIQSTIPSLQ